MIGVVVREEDGHFVSRSEAVEQGPDVCFHRRARIDHDYALDPYEVASGSVEGEGPLVGRQEDAGFQGGSPGAQRFSAMSCSANLSATSPTASSSSGPKAPGSMESTSMAPKISSPARIRTTSSEDMSELSSM